MKHFLLLSTVLPWRMKFSKCYPLRTKQWTIFFNFESNILQLCLSSKAFTKRCWQTSVYFEEKWATRSWIEGTQLKTRLDFEKHHCFDNTRKDITFHIHKRTPTLWQDLFELWYSFCNKTRRLWPQAIQFVNVHTKQRCCCIWMKSFLWLRWKQNNWYERVFFQSSLF